MFADRTGPDAFERTLPQVVPDSAPGSFTRDEELDAAVGWTGAGHRRFLSDFYSGGFPGSWTRGLVFQENETTGDRRISGAAASLAGLEAGDGLAIDRLLLGHLAVLGFGACR